MFVSPSAAQPASSPPCITPSSAAAAKLKRRPAGTPDPEAEVVSLSPRTLLESDRYVCEICNQGFQRDQNLQMHRRRHKVPWKLLKREGGAGEARKRVFVCPETSCLHHHPSHALGDLVGIKKHFRRKHSANKQWACARCSKAYAVHSDYKAHLKTCGTRGHSCDCGRVFSRVESFIEHQDTCNAGRELAAPAAAAAFLSRSPSMCPSAGIFRPSRSPLIELQLLPAAPGILPPPTFSPSDEDTGHPQKLQLSIGPSTAKDEKAAADDARRQAKSQLELAEQDFGNAKRIRRQAQIELHKAYSLRDYAAKKIHSTLLQITCFSCNQQFFSKPGAGAALISDDHSATPSYISSVMTEAEDDEQNPKDYLG